MLIYKHNFFLLHFAVYIKQASKKNILVGGTRTMAEKTSKAKFETCNACPYFRLLQDPDSVYCFSDNEQKAVCKANSKEIEDALSVDEANRVRTPSWCPKKEK